MNRLFEAFVKFIYGKSRAWRAMMTALSALIVFSTTYALILPAITLDSNRVYDEPGIELDDNYFEDVNYGENPSDAQGLVFEDTGDIYFDGNEPDVYIEDADNGYFDDTYFEDEADTYFENGDAGLFVDDENAFLAEDNEADLFGDVLFDDEAGLLPDPETADSMAVIVEDVIDVDSIVPEAEEPADIFVNDEDEAEFVEADVENVEAEETAAEADDAENDADDVEVSEAEDAEATDEAESEFADAADTEVTASVVEEAEAVYEFMAANAEEIAESEDAEASEADEAAEMTEAVASDAEEIESVESQIEEVVDAEEVVSEDEAESVSSEVEEVMDAEEAVPADAVESVSSEVEEVMDAAEPVSSDVEEVMDAADSTLSEVEDMIDYTDSTTSEVEDVVAFEEATWSDAESAAESVPSYANGVEDIEEVYPAVDFYRATPYVSVKVHADEGAFPAGTTMTVEDVEDEETITAITEAAEETEAKVRKLHAVNITFLNIDGQEIEPLIPISVEIRSEQIAENEKAMVVHVDDDGNATALEDVEVEARRNSAVAEVTKNGTGEGSEFADDFNSESPDSFPEDAVEFEADEFSVYAIVYTVDFHWEVDGKVYEFSLPGGGSVSLTTLVEILGLSKNDAQAECEDENEDNGIESIADETSEEGESGEDEPETTRILTFRDIEISEKTKEFVADVENVEFSKPELLWVGKVEADTTVGALKETNGLECWNSDELTEEQIEEVNGQVVEAGDWTLISVMPFTSEETLTITMKNGDQFVVNVTDAQDPSNFIDKEVIIYDKPDQRAMVSGGYPYENRYRLNSIALSEAEGNEAAHWTVEWYNNNYYLKSSDNRYLTINGNDVGLVNNRSVATPLQILPGSNPDYRIYAANEYNNVLSYSTNGNWGAGYFSAPGGKNGTESREWLYIREVETVPDRAGDWLLYFDDDFDEITIHVGETISLRPYNKWEWKEGSVNVQTAHWNIGGRDNTYWNQININDANGAHKESWDDGGTGSSAGFHWTAYVKKDDQLDTHYWAVQGQATQTGDYVLTNTKNGKTITVHVVDGAPVNKPQTINKVANIKVNLFDYDNGGRLDEGLVNGETNKNLANNSNFKNESVNQMGGSDHLYFLSSGSGNNANESWNNYTKDAPNTGIVQNTLNNAGYPVLNHGNHTSLQYLFDTSQASQSWHGGSGGNGMIAYPNVVGMFQKDNSGYYYYNSNTNYFYYDTATGTSKLYAHTYTQNSSASKGSLANDKPIGFFPFHDYDSTNDLYVNQNIALNHHVGLSMELEFMLPRDKKDDDGNDIIFDFSGDDDLWVFVEWVDDNGQKQSRLLLDLGGVHQPIHGDINFTSGSNTAFMQPNRPYTLKVFYLERGGCDSNCSIRFNLPIIQDLTVAKKLTGLTEEEKAKYTNEEFTYEIVVNGQPYNYPNPHNRYEKAVLRNAAGEDITPANFTITNGRVNIKDGQTLTITYLDRSDKFSVAELNTPNMENFEVPNAERYYHLESDASLHEEEIHLTTGQTLSEPHTADWVTPTYTLEDTEKVTFTNTLKEKNLEVEKKWAGDQPHPENVTFTVSASVDDGSGGRVPYAVKELKEADGTSDKVFTLSDANHWRYEIEHLPVNTPDGKFIFYDISEGHIDGYVLTGSKDITAEAYNYCNVDVVKLWPDSNGIHTEVLRVVLKNSEGKYYAGIGIDGEAVFSADPELASVYELKPENNYTHRFDRVPAGEYTAEQLNEDEYSRGLATYTRSIIQYELENTPLEKPVDPTGRPNSPEIHKRIDALRDEVKNPDSPHTGEDLTDLYRLYLDYKVNSLQEPDGVDLLFVIDHSGSMNNSEWPGNPYRAAAVMNALNGENGLISEFLKKSDKNQWAAVGFKGPDGASDYEWALTNPWNPSTDVSSSNAGQNGSEVLSSGGTTYEFTRQNTAVSLANEGASILSNYTAGFWRAEQFLLKQEVKEDGRKKVIVFISDGVPTLHIGNLDNSLQNAGTAAGSNYYREEYGGCPDQALTEFGYFVNDIVEGGYTFGGNMEFYTIGFGASMQTESGAVLLNDMLNSAYGEESDHTGHFMTVTDAQNNDDRSAVNKLKEDLRTILGLNETFSNIVIQDNLSKYVDLYGLVETASDASAIMAAAKAKVTMTVPGSDEPTLITLYENGAPATSDSAKFTKSNGETATIIKELRYDASTKTVQAVFDPEYRAVEYAVYTLSFDVKATDEAYTTYAETGYDTYTSGENQGRIITGDPDTDFLGTNPANATSVDKEGFRSNDEAKATYDHNGKDEEKVYPHPVIQVSARVDIVKTDQTGAALEGAIFNLYGDSYDPTKTIEENAGSLIEADLQSKKPVNPEGEYAVIRSGKLTVGTYYLVEIKAPDGYNRLSGPVKIIITENSGALNMTAEIAGEAVGGDKLIKISNGAWRLSLQNSAGYELPSTGGFGTKPFTIGGMMLVLMSLMLYCIGGRRRTLAEEFSLGAGGSAGRKGGDPRL